MKKLIGLLVAGIMVIPMASRATAIVYNAALVNETALSHDNTYPLDLLATGIGSLSAQATYSSATVPSVTFGDGAQATGGITVLNYAALVSARAADNVTVVTNTGLTGATLSLPGSVLREGIEWAVGSTPTNTAISLAAALARVPRLSVSRVGTVIFTTATAGSYNNSLQMESSTPTALTVATQHFVGGQDNASVKINGVVLLQGRDFTAATSNAATATSLKNAINAASLLNTKLTAEAIGALVTSTSTKAGALYNYSLVSSTPTALSVSGANMTGGITPAETLGSAVLRAPLHGLTPALAVLYGTAGGTIGGLTDQTTYYAIVVDANNLKLATSAPLALAGTGVVVTSTSTQLSANSYTLSPLAITGVPGFKWQVSNNNSSWEDLAVSSVTVSSYSNPPATMLWSFGAIGTRYIRLNVVAPTTGGLSLNVQVVGSN